MLEGELERDDGLLVATVRLMDGESGVVLLSERFEQGLEEILVLERQIAEELTRFLSLPMSRRERRWLGSDPTTVLEAYRFYSRGMRHLENWYGPDRQNSVRSAAENFRQAVRLDPTFAAAYAGLVRALDARYSLDPDADFLRDAEVALENALAIDPELPEALVAQIRLRQTKGEFTSSLDDLEQLLLGHPRPDEAYRTIARGYEQAGDLESAQRILEAAVALAEDVWDNWNYLGSIRLNAGEFDEARASFTRAAELAPPDVLTPQANLFAVELYEGKFREAVALIADIEPERMDAGLSSNVASAYFYLEDYDNSERFYRRAIELEPNTPLLHRNLGDLFVRTGKIDLARAEFLVARNLTDQFLRESPASQGRLIERALYSAKAGDCSDAVQRSRAIQDTWNPTGAGAQQLAQAFALCASPDEAVSLLRRALALGISPEVVAVEDEFSSLRVHPDFISLIQTAP